MPTSMSVTVQQVVITTTCVATSDAIVGLMTAFAGLTLDILKMASWVHMGRTANIIIKDTIHIFVSISKILRIVKRSFNEQRLLRTNSSERLPPGASLPSLAAIGEGLHPGER